MDLEKVFVYGSLKNGFYNNEHYLRDATFKGRFQTQPQWGLISLGAFPAMVMGSLAVKGEVFEVNKTTLAGLDRLEGTANGFYKRIRIPVTDVNGNGEVDVWAYMYAVQPKNHMNLMTEWVE